MNERRPREKKPRLMAVFAHPDDEGQIAGMMAKYSSKKAEISLICATRGELGMTDNPSLLVGKTVEKLREEELRCACNVLGVKNLRFLNYKDGSLHLADPDEVVSKLMDIILELRPQVVITFGPEGLYGHRDHIAISGWVTSAFHASCQKQTSEGMQFHTKLYYTAFPKSLFDGLRNHGIEFKFEIEGAVYRVDGVPDDRITTVIDVAEFQTQKIEAFRSHRSQIHVGDLRWMIMEGELIELLTTERLVRVFPPKENHREIEKEVFD